MRKTLTESILSEIDATAQSANDLINKIFGPILYDKIQVKNDILSFPECGYLILYTNIDDQTIEVVEPERGNPQAIIKTTNGAITYIARESFASSFTYYLKVDESTKEIKDTDKLYGHTLAEIKQQPDLIDYLEKIYGDYYTKKRSNWENKDVQNAEQKVLNSKDEHDLGIVIRDIINYGGYTAETYLDMLNRALAAAYDNSSDNDKLTNKSFATILGNFKDLLSYGYMSYDPDYYPVENWRKVNDKIIRKHFEKNQYEKYSWEDHLSIKSLKYGGQRVFDKFKNYLVSYIKAHPGQKEFSKEFIDGLFSLANK